MSGTKHDKGKVRIELVPLDALWEVAKAFTFGAEKYSDNNWRGGFKWTRLIGSAMRHLIQWSRGEDVDPESGLSHLAHCGACILMLISHERNKYGEDDRNKN